MTEYSLAEMKERESLISEIERLLKETQEMLSDDTPSKPDLKLVK
jgi:hypothetical protein